MIVLSDHQFRERAAAMTARFEHLGDVVERHYDDPPRHKIRWTISAPNTYSELGRFLFDEVFAWADDRWNMLKYAYEFQDLAHGGRRAYHWHNLNGVASFHAHCASGSTAVHPHYRFIPLLLEEAHHELARIYALDAGVDCSDLFPGLE